MMGHASPLYRVSPSRGDCVPSDMPVLDLQRKPLFAMKAVTPAIARHVVLCSLENHKDCDPVQPFSLKGCPAYTYRAEENGLDPENQGVIEKRS